MNHLNATKRKQTTKGGRVTKIYPVIIARLLFISWFRPFLSLHDVPSGTVPNKLGPLMAQEAPKVYFR